MLDVKFLLPSFTEAEAVRLAEEWYGLHGTARTLPSERDRNFLLTAESGEQFVLKISNAAASGPGLATKKPAPAPVRSSPPCPRKPPAATG